MQNNVFYIDNVDGCRCLQIIGDDKHGYEAIWQNPRCKCELVTFDTYQETVHAIKKYYRYEHVKRAEL